MKFLEFLYTQVNELCLVEMRLLLWSRGYDLQMLS